MKKIAHRGYKTSNIKENTKEAFTNALNNSFDGIEFDVRKTKDGELVVVHDASVERVSDGEGLVRDQTYANLLKYNFGSANVPSKIPLLKDVLSDYKGTIKLVELKCSIDLESILELVDENTYFISFDSSLIKKLKKKYPDLKFGILNYVLNSINSYDLDAICLLDQIATDELVMKFLSRGIKVFIYGIIGNINYKRDYKDLYYIVDKKF